MPFINGEVPSSSGRMPLDTHQEVVAGDDYKSADGRALTWSSDVWPDLTGAALTMTVGHEQYNLYGNLPVTWTATLPTPLVQPGVASLDVTSAQTSVLTPDEYDYQLTATLADGDKVTLAIGKLTVWASPGTTPLYSPAT